MATTNRSSRSRILDLVQSSASLLCITVALIIGYGGKHLQLVDLLLWLATLSIARTTWKQYKVMGSRSSIVSSYSIQLLSTITAVTARIALTIYALSRACFLAPPIGCPTLDMSSTTGIVLLYSLLQASMLSILHSVGVVLNVCGPRLTTIVSKTAEMRLRLLSTVRRHPIAIAFAVSFLVRFVPELRHWPYPIGWDTVEYIAHLRDFTTSPNPFVPHIWLGGLRNLPPLLDIVLGYLSFVVDPWWIMKVWPAIEVGLVGALGSYVARKILRLTPEISILTGIVTSLHIVTIASSIQWHRHVIGLAMLLLAVVMLELHHRTKPTLVSAILILASLSYEPVAFMSSALSLYAIARLGTSGRRAKLLYFLAFALSITMLARYIYSPASRSSTYRNPYLGIAPRGTIEYRWSTTINDVLAWIAIYIVPLAIGFAMLKKHAFYRFTVLTLLMVGIAPALFPYCAPAEMHRLFALLVPLLIPAAIKGYAELGKQALAIVTLILVLPGLADALLPPVAADFYVGYLRVLKFAWAKGFPWTFSPPGGDQGFQQLLRTASIVAHLHRETGCYILTHVQLWPCIHLYIRHLNIRDGRYFHYEPSAETILEVYNATKETCFIVVTRIDLIRYLQELQSEKNLSVHIIVSRNIRVWRASLYIVLIWDDVVSNNVANAK